MLRDHTPLNPSRLIQGIGPWGGARGHFFGPQDEYGKDSRNSIHTEEEIAKLFTNFEIEFFEERNEAGLTIGGIEKHWHIFSVVAVKC